MKNYLKQYCPLTEFFIRPPTLKRSKVNKEIINYLEVRFQMQRFKNYFAEPPKKRKFKKRKIILTPLNNVDPNTQASPEMTKRTDNEMIKIEEKPLLESSENPAPQENVKINEELPKNGESEKNPKSAEEKKPEEEKKEENKVKEEEKKEIVKEEEAKEQGNKESPSKNVETMLKPQDPEQKAESSLINKNTSGVNETNPSITGKSI